MQVQGSGDYRRSYDARSCTHDGGHPTEDFGILIHGISEGEKFTDDLRKACPIKV
ncbi:hypothetical protein D3C80_2060910 [compost metagenome]